MFYHESKVIILLVLMYIKQKNKKKHLSVKIRTNLAIFPGHVQSPPNQIREPLTYRG